MHCSKRWNVAEPDNAADELAARLKISPLIAQVLLNRGVREQQACADFLRPSLKLRVKATVDSALEDKTPPC